MALEIVFSPHALDMLLSIESYIHSNWGSKSAEKFMKSVQKKLDLTAINPYMYKASSIEENIRKGLISRQTSFFYEVYENELIILFFWDNRQEPFFTD